MKLYQVAAVSQSTQEHRHLYEVSAEQAGEALFKAEQKHAELGRRFMGFSFEVIGSRIVLCPTAIPEAA
jgi:hypothetical protein